MVPIFTLALWFSSSSDEGKTVFYAFCGLFAGIWLFIKGFRTLQRKRLILDTPTSKVRSAAIGLVELNGIAVGPNTITSPLTQRPCFYYRTAVWKEVGSGKNRHWEQKIDERFHVPFFVQDETGMLLVDPNGAEMDIHCDFKAEYNRSMFTSASVPPRVSEFAGRHMVALDDNIRVEEYCIKPQNALYLLGTLATNTGLKPVPIPMRTDSSGLHVGKLDLGGGSSGLVASLMSLAATNITVNVTRAQATKFRNDPAKLTELDRKMAEYRAQEAAKEGRQGTSPAALHPNERTQAALAALVAQNPQLAAMAAQNPALVAAAEKNPAIAGLAAAFLGGNVPQVITGGAAAAAGPAKDSAPATPAVNYPEECPTVLCKGKHDPTFYISWRSQKEIVSDLSKRSALFILGGPALTVACAAYLLYYFKVL